jgi:hypothetical protein
MHSRFFKFRKFYKELAVILLNTVVLFLFLNGLVWLFFHNGYPESSITNEKELNNSAIRLGALRYDFDDLRTVYPDLTDQHIIQLLLEVWNLPLDCDDKTYFRETAFTGSFVNVDAAGFRRILDQALWPPDDDAYNIFVFGGSTTFGYGEMDRRTIPSFMQRQLRSGMGDDVSINVYNFGHGFYFSRQERLEFERLIAAGNIPDLAIFIDGLNEFVHWSGEPESVPCNPANTFSVQLRNTLACKENELCWPIQRLAANLNAFSEPNSDLSEVKGEVPAPRLDDEDANQLIVERWLENKTLIEETAEANNIRTLFIWQPNPAYAYDLDYHLFADSLDDLGATARAYWGYPIWEQMVLNENNQENNSNIINLSYLLQEKREPLFVDRVHYTTSFSREIAILLSNKIIEQNIIQTSPKYSE